MSEHVTWETCPSCGRPAALGWLDGDVWCAHCVHLADIRNFGDMVQKAVRTAHAEEIAAPGTRIVITAGVPFGTPGSTNVIHIVRLVGDELERYRAGEA